ncbi:MAG TPA: BatA domain-containing protein, partial [Pirellulales bacterium]|nr:BatA domain-containing protein [Pirellulales bacterium]
MFTLANPLFLIGLSAAAIPLLIHLSRSRRTKKIQFSTTRFFTDQFLRSYRMSRLKELLLLACRMALCVALALALAGPMLLPRGGPPLVGQSRAVVLVLDNSASMGLEQGGDSMLDRARRAARDVLDSLRPGDTASLVLAGRRAKGPEVLFAELTPQLGDVRQALDGVRPSSLGTDLSTAVIRARSIVERSAADSKEVYVLSDLQDSGWEVADADEAAPADADALVFFVRVRPEEPEDLAVTAVQYSAARPMVGVPFAIRPHVRNQSRHVRSCVVKLWIDGELVGERKLEQLQAGRWEVPRFHHTFRKGGWHEGYVEVEDGSLPADDRRYIAFEVVDAVEVLAINGAPSRIARLDELFFLKTALAATEGDKSPIRLDQAAPEALATVDLAKYRAVLLANVESVPAAGVEKLESFVDKGGSLLMFLGDRTNQPFFNQVFAGENRLHGGLSPARLVGLEGKPARVNRGDDKFNDGGQSVASVGQIDLDHPVLAAFDDPRSANLAGVTFQALWTVEPGASAVLMRANTASPLLVEKVFGKGRVMLFASTCDRDWTNFPVRPAYLPWIYRLVGYLAQEPLARQGFYHTGDVVPL